MNHGVSWYQLLVVRARPRYAMPNAAAPRVSTSFGEYLSDRSAGWDAEERRGEVVEHVEPERERCCLVVAMSVFDELRCAQDEQRRGTVSHLERGDACEKSTESALDDWTDPNLEWSARCSC